MGLALLTLAVIIIIASFFVDGPLRRSIERGMNEALTGYSVTIDKAHLSIFRPAVFLNRMILRQQGPDGERTVAVIPRLKASVQWRAFLTGHLVSDFTLERPIINISRSQWEKENTDAVDIEDRGWQKAAEEIFPFRINSFTISGGDLTYIHKDPAHPINVSELNLELGNIRNVHSAEREYPSSVHAAGVLFGKGHVTVDGEADFLAEPSPAIRFTYGVADVPLDDISTLTSQENVTIRGGVLESRGNVEYAPWVKLYHISNVTVSNIGVDYHHNLPRALGNVNEAVSEANNDPDYILRIDTINVRNSELGMNRNRGKHPYRLFFTHTNATITHYSNHFRAGVAVGRMQAQFMGSGRTAVTAHFRPEHSGPDFDLAVAIEDANLVSMNQMLSAHGKLDVTKGRFAVYSQLDVANHRMTGYIKPIFTDVTIYDWKQDRNNNVFNQLYQLVVSGVTKLFERGKDDAVTTRAHVSGPVGKTTIGTWELIANAFENAFIKAIRPGFDKVLGREPNVTNQKRKGS